MAGLRTRRLPRHGKGQARLSDSENPQQALHEAEKKAQRLAHPINSESQLGLAALRTVRSDSGVLPRFVPRDRPAGRPETLA